MLRPCRATSTAIRRLLAGATLLSGAACYPGAVTDVSELDVVAALHADTARLDGVRTYAMPDTVLHRTSTLGGQETVPVSRAFDAQILADVARNLESLGFVRELQPQAHRPDVVVLVTVTATQEIDAWVSYPWFGWWGFYPGWTFFPAFTAAWGVSYPWAGSVSAYTWTQGTLIVDMIDARSPDIANLKISSVWAGALNGVLQSDSPSGSERIQSGIDEMFRLSPYLQR